MAEEKKRGRGRPPKKVENRGGKREGAGRKPKYDGDAMSAHITFRVKEATYHRVRQLRELTKDDEMPFNRMFEKWVEEYAQDYGIE